MNAPLPRNDLSAFWMPFTDNRGFKRDPRMFVGAKDMHYVTPDGREVLDATSGLWCVNAGHCREPIVEAIRRQAGELDYAPSFQLGHPLAFELAAATALREAVLKAAPVVLEPVMAVEVVTPAESLGDVIGDLLRRRGQVQGHDVRGTAVVLTAQVPLAQMFGYIGHLRALSAGRAQFTMQLSHHAEVPARLALAA